MIPPAPPPARIEGWRNARRATDSITDRRRPRRRRRDPAGRRSHRRGRRDHGPLPRDGKVRLLQLATPERDVRVDVFETADLSPLKEVLEDGPVKALHNAKFDYQFLHDPARHLALPRLRHDARGAAPRRRGLLGVVLARGGGRALPGRVAGQVRAEERLVRRSSRSRQLEYAARDAAVLLPLRERLAGGARGGGAWVWSRG